MESKEIACRDMGLDCRRDLPGQYEVDEGA